MIMVMVLTELHDWESLIGDFYELQIDDVTFSGVKGRD